MSKMTLSEELKWRGLFHQTTFKDLKELDKKKFTFYFGVDANSAPSMTVGNLASAMMLKKFIEYGHTPILLAGGATGRIGDPKPDEERPEVTDDTVELNKNGIISQFISLFGGVKPKLVDNYDWFKDIGYVEFLQTIGKHIGMGQMLDRDFVKSRTGVDGSGISYAEFSYSLIQGYDFLHLFREEGVTLQLCGSDQWINCIAGVDMIRKLEQKEAHVWSGPLIVNKATGKKFGKSEDGAIWLDPNMTSIYKYYQFWLNADDEGVGDYIKVYTNIQPDEYDSIMKDFNSDPSTRNAQKYLAYESTRIVHGEKAANTAKQLTEILFEGADSSRLTNDQYKELAKELPTSKEQLLINFLIDSGLVNSKSEARRLIEQGAVSVNGAKATLETTVPDKGLVKKGKNTFALRA